HHRRGSGPNSPPHVPIPVSSFAHRDRRPSPVRASSPASSASSDDEESPQLRERHLPNLDELREAILEQLPPQRSASPPGSPDHRFLGKPVISPTDNLSSSCGESLRSDYNTSDGEHSSSPNTPPEETLDFPRMIRKKSGELVKPSLKTSRHRRRPVSLP